MPAHCGKFGNKKSLEQPSCPSPTANILEYFPFLLSSTFIYTDLSAYLASHYL